LILPKTLAWQTTERINRDGINSIIDAIKKHNGSFCDPGFFCTFHSKKSILEKGNTLINLFSTIYT